MGKVKKGSGDPYHTSPYKTSISHRKSHKAGIKTSHPPSRQLRQGYHEDEYNLINRRNHKQIHYRGGDIGEPMSYLNTFNPYAHPDSPQMHPFIPTYNDMTTSITNRGPLLKKTVKVKLGVSFVPSGGY